MKNDFGGLVQQVTKICETVSRKFETPPDLLISRLSFSHIQEIMFIDDPFERSFYELEYIKGTLSVRELRKLIPTCFSGPESAKNRGCFCKRWRRWGI